MRKFSLCMIKPRQKLSRSARFHYVRCSQAPFKTLSSCLIGSKLVWNCIEKLIELRKRNQVALLSSCLIVGIPGNEEAKAGADNLATAHMQSYLIISGTENKMKNVSKNCPVLALQTSSCLMTWLHQTLHPTRTGFFLILQMLNKNGGKSIKRYRYLLAKSLLAEILI